ncbi:OmpA family protein [Lewinella sp. W8]|uniref:OmpA family protein n=1 Tax=Lewinella sp. W8 TaxID=2528208 RepID=UPI0010680791|nr:OmpA family protein [Lewinella sp. W8]MTB53375.1 OmpA family protein [Lewinella sp. W8]
MKELFLLLFFGSLLTACAVAQSGATTLSELKKKETKILDEAQLALDREQYAVAREKFSLLLDKYPQIADLYFRRAQASGGQQDYDAAIADMQRGIELDGDKSTVAYRVLGDLQQRAGAFAGAVSSYETYLSRLSQAVPPNRREAAEAKLSEAKVAAELAANPVPFTPRPVKGMINTKENLEYFPSLSVDGQRMIFTRRTPGRGNFEDFYQSERQPDGSWGPGAPITSLNSEYGEAAQTLTADEQYMVFTACLRPDGLGSCDLYFSEKRDGKWSTPQNMGEVINSGATDRQPSISADGRLLFFSSNRPGGYGGDDLYVTGRGPSGNWSPPVNLGPVINTKGNDQFPFWANDGKTLFFTSNGHPGMGGDDLFRSQLTPDNAWGTPGNLGYPINTPEDEANLFISLNGEQAYFSKSINRADNPRPDVDIFEFDLPPSLRPDPATYVEATVTDAVTGEALVASVRLRPLDQETPPFVQTSNAEGRFLSVLPTGREYALTVDREGYLYYTDRFSLDEGYAVDNPFLLTIQLQPLEEIGSEIPLDATAEDDGAIPLKNVLFATGSADLLPVSGDELDRLYALLNNRQDLMVEIAGHTDNVGEEDDNLQLSLLRAEAVKAYLEAKGIAEDRLITKGYGEQKPVATNDTEAGRSKNRRTTFRLLTSE